MAINRIQISDTSAGTGERTFFRNPSYVDFQDTENHNSIPILHGAQAWHDSAWDDRPRELVWDIVDFEVASAFISSAKAWKGSVRWFNFRDLDDINTNWPVNNTWKKARVLDASGKIRKGGALVYETFTMILQPEQ